MSTAELKQTAESLNAAERIFLAAYLKHLSRVDDPAYQAQLTRLNDEIEGGKKLTLDQAQHLHETRKAQGLRSRTGRSSSTRPPSSSSSPARRENARFS